MCLGIALAGSEVPTEMTGHLIHRLYMRGERPEYRFDFRDRWPRLPIRRDGQFRIVHWGNRGGRRHVLPPGGWVWQSELDEGLWRHSEADLIDILASYCLDRRGVWVNVDVGIRGILVPDEDRQAVAYMICMPSSHHYKTMTGSDRMPVFIDQTI